MLLNVVPKVAYSLEKFAVQVSGPCLKCDDLIECSVTVKMPVLLLCPGDFSGVILV